MRILSSTAAFLLIVASPAHTTDQAVEFGARIPDVLNIARAGEAPKSPLATPANEELPQPVEWIPIKGGTFLMGTEDGEGDKEKPVHKVTLKSFELTRTLVTVEQYEKCVRAHHCTEPDSYTQCNWNKSDRKRHPINCVDWYQANQYAQYMRARLPSEAEYEYAATSGNGDNNQKYPWGNEPASCTRAAMYGNGGPSCGDTAPLAVTAAVCSKPAGNTTIAGLPAEQQLCDMVGNVWEWMQDSWHWTYHGAPSDGRAWQSLLPGSRVVRGGSARYAIPLVLRAAHRSFIPPAGRNMDSGFRLARDVQNEYE